MKAGLPAPPNNSTNPTTLEAFSARMKQANYSEETIERYVRNLRTLISRGANLNDPSSIEMTKAQQKCSEGSKQVFTNSAILYFKLNGITLTMTTYKRVQKMPFIPQETEIDKLISGCKHGLATFLQVLKETACRYGEAFILTWKDHNTESATLSITPEKGSNPRAIKITPKLQTMLNTLPKNSEKIFNYKERHTKKKLCKS